MRHVEEAIVTLSAHLGNRVAEQRETLPREEFLAYRNEVLTTLRLLAVEVAHVEALIAAEPPIVAPVAQVEVYFEESEMAMKEKGLAKEALEKAKEAAKPLPKPAPKAAVKQQPVDSILSGLTKGQNALLQDLLGDVKTAKPVAAQPAPQVSKPAFGAADLLRIPPGAIAEAKCFLKDGPVEEDTILQLSKDWEISVEKVREFVKYLQSNKE